MIDRAKLIDGYPIAEYIAKQGIELKGKGKELVGLCPFHQDKNPSMSVNPEKGVYHCFTCGAQGSLIDFCMNLKGLSCKDAMYALAQDINLADEPVQKMSYKYKDALGRDVMEVERIQEGRNKKFVQFRIDHGKRVPGVQGIQRTLYRIESWANAPEIELVEGEKCADAMESLGYNATCNAGGALAWIAGYATYLQDKHVTLWPDRDEAGSKWCDAVMATLGDIPASVRICNVFAPYGDVADIVTAKGADIAVDVIADIAMKVPRIQRGQDLPIYSADDLMQQYAAEVTSDNPIKLDLGRWLPSLRDWVKPCVAGDMVSVLAGTGTGKTMILQNILACSQLPSLFFELELSNYLVAERFAAMTNRTTSEGVEKTYAERRKLKTDFWNHVWTCTDASMTIEKMYDIISKAELRMGERPRVVAVDYIQLMKDGSSKRYESVSNIAEKLKILAKECKVILLVASQVGRPNEKTDEIQEVFLTSAKESGSIENSSSLVLGAWKTESKNMVIRILKNTRGQSGHKIDCNFDGAKYRISQRIYGVNDNE